jgi:bifunctional non-homologous end joining protein LigD
MASNDEKTVKIEGKKFKLSRLDKVLFPGEGYTKQDVIDYYRKISEIMLPHVQDRPLTVQRYPDGIDEEGFFQKERPDYFPDWIESTRVKKKEGGEVDYVLCQNQATLVYLANQGCITFHTWLGKEKKLNRPDRLIIDLDPPDENKKMICEAARLVHRFLDEELALTNYAKLTGSSGIHVMAALDETLDFEEVRDIAGLIVRILAKRHSDELTTEIRKDKRRGRVFLDIARNAYAQTAVAPYSLRAKEGAPIACPIDWDELKCSNFDPQKYHLKNIFKRTGQKGDPWSDIKVSSLKSVQKTLQRISGNELKP